MSSGPSDRMASIPASPSLVPSLSGLATWTRHHLPRSLPGTLAKAIACWQLRSPEGSQPGWHRSWNLPPHFTRLNGTFPKWTLFLWAVESNPSSVHASFRRVAGPSFHTPKASGDLDIARSSSVNLGWFQIPGTEGRRKLSWEKLFWASVAWLSMVRMQVKLLWNTGNWGVWLPWPRCYIGLCLWTQVGYCLTLFQKNHYCKQEL